MTGMYVRYAEVYAFYIRRGKSPVNIYKVTFLTTRMDGWTEDIVGTGDITQKIFDVLDTPLSIVYNPKQKEICIFEYFPPNDKTWDWVVG